MTTILVVVFDRWNDYTSSTSRGSCLEPKHLSMSFNLNQISIFMSGRCKHWVKNQYNLKRSGCILAQMGLRPDTLKLPQIAFRGFLFTLCRAAHRACQKIVQPALIFYSLPHSVTVTNVAFLFVPNGLKETLRHRECGSRREARRAAEERGRERTLMHGEDGTGSIILRSAYVCLCVTEHWRGSLMVCLCVCVCMCACIYLYMCVCAREWREASGEKRMMKRMSVPLRKCHTGKICRF